MVVSFSIGVSLSIISLPFYSSENPDILLRFAASASLAELATKPHSQRLQAEKATRNTSSGSKGVISTSKPPRLSTFAQKDSSARRENTIKIRRSRKARCGVQKVVPVAVGVVTLAAEHRNTFVARQRQSFTAV